MATNTVTVIGNLVEDPELRFTGSGVAMARIRCAVNRRWRDQQGEWQEETSFLGGTLWREAAENAAESLQKGMRVIITGRLDQRSCLYMSRMQMKPSHKYSNRSLSMITL